MPKTVSVSPCLLVWCFAALYVVAPLRPSLAIEEISQEEDIADLLPNTFPGRNGAVESRPWAILPQVGYGPETGPLGGIKYTHRDVFGGATFDADITYALNKQQSAAFSLAFPRLDSNNLILLLRARYRLDPQRDYFGLGNNDFGPDPISTNLFQDIGASITLGWRPLESVALNFSVGFRKVNIRNGERLEQCQNFMAPGTTIRPCPFTPVAFPDLPGVDGGIVTPLALSVVWTNRDSIMRPTRGWRLILKIIAAGSALGGFEFTRYIGDVSYLRSFFEKRVILGARLNGEYVDTYGGDVTYWELSELGGRDTLRGFFPHRFLGQGRILLNTEMRARVLDFDFFDLWHVHMDGVLFADAGRVFANSQDLKDQFHVDSNLLSNIIKNFRYDYGFGVRFALSEALVARIDVGFSEEEKGLVYLAFGHTF